jgi:hypothetical protein
LNIYFNRKPVEGPWGGGSKMLTSIVNECISRGHKVYFENEVSFFDVDIIFCMDPRPTQYGSHTDLIRAKKKGVRILQRVGDLGTHGKPELFTLQKELALESNTVVFPSTWAKESLGTRPDGIVIHNAPLPDFISTKPVSESNGTVKIVTHHWSDNMMKGFDTYKRLDDLCNKSNGRLSFTFIGRKPIDLQVTNHINPLDVCGLVKELPKHDVYFTASLFEAGANHVLEAMGLGLPVLFHKDGGSIPEYCKGRGAQYSTPEEALTIISEGNIPLQVLPLTRTSLDAAREYVDMMETMQ